jgi:GNAT superfamily N-acetyltransferase
MNMDFKPIQADDTSLARYAALFRACFPNASHLGETYLRWLYQSNPDGVVVGFDAIEGDRLAGHYACIPVSMDVAGKRTRGLLSLNTATHPDFQGQGLFTKLAAKTYEYAAEKGFSGVYGIANANSTPGFIRKLGFSLISPLEARIGVGRPASVDWSRAAERTQFSRVWSDKSLAWRCANPVNAVSLARSTPDGIELRAATDKPFISAWATLPPGPSRANAGSRSGRPVTLFLGLLPEGAHRFHASAPIPDRFRPSPLNFIYRSLEAGGVVPEQGTVMCSFVDFDAY